MDHQYIKLDEVKISKVETHTKIDAKQCEHRTGDKEKKQIEQHMNIL